MLSFVAATICAHLSTPANPRSFGKAPCLTFREHGSELELELVQSHMAQKPVLRGEVGCACAAREVSVEREGMGERGCARRLGGWVWVLPDATHAHVRTSQEGSETTHTGQRATPTPSHIISSHRSATHTPNTNLDLDLHPTYTLYPPGRHCQGVKANNVAWPNAKAFFIWARLRFELREELIGFTSDMGRPERLRRKLRGAEHFATLAADAAALAGNAKSGARLAPAQRGRMGASLAAVSAAYEERCPGGRRIGASPAAVNSAAENRMWLRMLQRQGLSYTPCRRERLLWSSLAGKLFPQSLPGASLTSSAQWPRQPRGRLPRARRQPLATAGDAARSSRLRRG